MNSSERELLRLLALKSVWNRVSGDHKHEFMTEMRLDLAIVEKLKAEFPPDRFGLPPRSIIHILKHGIAMCGQRGMPCDWPEGERWVSFETVKTEPGEVRALLCEPCIREHEKQHPDPPQKKA